LIGKRQQCLLGLLERAVRLEPEVLFTEHIDWRAWLGRKNPPQGLSWAVGEAVF
jgi:hypothetical protein